MSSIRAMRSRWRKRIKYLFQFGKWLGIWISRDSNREVAELAFGRDRLEAVLAGEWPSVAETFRLFQGTDLKGEFCQYFLGKTHLSYELKGKPTPKDQPRNTDCGPYYSKLAEFVYIILAEYLALHNYQFVSKTKADGVITVDSWMRRLGK